MKVVRLARDPLTLVELREMYPEPHDHERWGRGHGERVELAISTGIELAVNIARPKRIVDLSAGNGAIAHGIAAGIKERLGPPWPSVVLGDFAPGHFIEGSIEETMFTWNEISTWSRSSLATMFVNAETLEHLNDPPTALRRIRRASRTAVISTPIDNFGDENLEHLWAWDREHVEAMLDWAGFKVVMFDNVDSRNYGETYNYGVWGVVNERTDL